MKNLIFILLVFPFIVNAQDCEISANEILQKMNCDSIVEHCPILANTDDQCLTTNVVQAGSGANIIFLNTEGCTEPDFIFTVDPSTTNELQSLTRTYDTLMFICYEARGYNNTVEHQRGMTVVNNGNGLYTAIFPAVHPDGNNYTVTFGAEEDANRDVPKIHIVRGSRNALGFDFEVTVDDNGAGADIRDNSGWHLQVSCQKRILTDVEISTNG